MTATKDIAVKIAAAANDKKARDIQILSMEQVSLITDYFIICSAGSATQARAVADSVEEKLAEAGARLLHREGYREGRWVLLDYGCCVAHIFVEEERRYYNLERLWGDAAAELYEA